MAPSGCCSAATRASDALSAEEEVSPPRLPLRAEATTLLLGAAADCLESTDDDADAEGRFFFFPLLMRSSLAHSSAFLEGLATAEMTDWRFALEEKAAGLLRASTASLDERRSSIGLILFFFETGEGGKRKNRVVWRSRREGREREERKSFLLRPFFFDEKEGRRRALFFCP